MDFRALKLSNLESFRALKASNLATGTTSLEPIDRMDAYHQLNLGFSRIVPPSAQLLDPFVILDLLDTIYPLLENFTTFTEADMQIALS